LRSYGNTIEIFGRSGHPEKNHGHRHGLRAAADQSWTRTRTCRPALKHVAAADVAKDFEDRLRAGGLGYGDLKKALFENYWSYFADARKKRTELAANLDYVEQSSRRWRDESTRPGANGSEARRKNCGLE